MHQENVENIILRRGTKSFVRGFTLTIRNRFEIILRARQVLEFSHSLREAVFPFAALHESELWPIRNVCCAAG